MVSFPAAEFAEFNALLATAAERGLPLEPVLALLSAQAGSSRVRAALESVHRGLRDGRPLPDALRTVPEFPPDYITLVEAGHAAGRLAEVLRHAAVYHSLRARLRARLGRVALYLGVGALAACGLMVGGAVLSERIGVDVYDLFQMTELAPIQELTRHPFRTLAWALPSMLLAGVLGWLCFRFLTRFRAGYWLPFWGGILRSRDLALFCSLAALRLSAGATALDAFRSARGAVPNFHARRRIGDLIRRLEEGATVSDALFYVRWFPRTLAWGVSLGERRGDVPEVFESCARIYAGQVDRGFEMLTVALGPLGILVLGNVALFAAMSALAPMFAMIRIQQALSW